VREEQAVEDRETFNHDTHCRLLEEAESELRMLGKDHLAGAVMRAKMIHRQLESRVAEARHVDAALARIEQDIHQQRRALQEYVGQGRGPWAGPDLFGEEWGR
jgi:hypothetical protein